MTENKGKQAGALGVAALVALHRLGASGRLTEVGQWLAGRGLEVDSGALHTTLRRLVESGDVLRDDGGGVPRYVILDGAYERMRQWGVGVSWIVDEIELIIREYVDADRAPF